jgi:predicted AlkP superfamily phosphohydrolase/phosphomutase
MHGSVRPGAEADALTNEIAARLSALEDPLTGEKVISSVYKPKEVYNGPYVAKAPDLVLGYNRHYRASWETILGKYPREELVDNRDKWSGDHCMDRDFIPGVLLCSKAPEATAPALCDLAPTILHEFGIPKPTAMIGTSLWGGKR